MVDKINKFNNSLIDTDKIKIITINQLTVDLVIWKTFIASDTVLHISKNYKSLVITHKGKNKITERKHWIRIGDDDNINEPSSRLLIDCSKACCKTVLFSDS